MQIKSPVARFLRWRIWRNPAIILKKEKIIHGFIAFSEEIVYSKEATQVRRMPVWLRKQES
jgi:hypothetical protein